MRAIESLIVDKIFLVCLPKVPLLRVLYVEVCMVLAPSPADALEDFSSFPVMVMDVSL